MAYQHQHQQPTNDSPWYHTAGYYGFYTSISCAGAVFQLGEKIVPEIVQDERVQEAFEDLKQIAAETRTEVHEACNRLVKDLERARDDIACSLEYQRMLQGLTEAAQQCRQQARRLADEIVRETRNVWPEIRSIVDDLLDDYGEYSEYSESLVEEGECKLYSFYDSDMDTLDGDGFEENMNHIGRKIDMITHVNGSERLSGSGYSTDAESDCSEDSGNVPSLVNVSTAADSDCSEESEDYSESEEDARSIFLGEYDDEFFEGVNSWSVV